MYKKRKEKKDIVSIYSIQGIQYLAEVKKTILGYINLELTAALGCVFKSSKATTVKGLLVLWSNFQGLSMVPLTVYLTYPTPPSNEEGRFGGSVKENGNTCCPGGNRLSSPVPTPVQFPEK